MNTWDVDLSSSDGSDYSEDEKPKNLADDDVADDWDASSDDEEPEPKKEEAPVTKQSSSSDEEPEVKPQSKSKIRYEEEIIPEHLRSPICVIMGHVDTGKTKLLDKIRKSNVQDGEAGGITQQIGATYFPVQTLKNITKFFKDIYKLEYNNPGLLIIDTPGHESFSNLRSRGSSLCDIAILVVDIMHGIEKQTQESIDLLRKKKTPFIIALNKIDRLNDWKPNPGQPFVQTFKQQNSYARDHYEKLLESTMKGLEVYGVQRINDGKEADGLQGIPFYKMRLSEKDFGTQIPIVPTSAITGEGIPDLLALVQLLTQNYMANRLTSKNELQCTVLEVKNEGGIGYTLDVILVNGVLHVNDTIVLAGMNGPIVTHIRALLTPEHGKELRVKSQWRHHDKIYAAMGCKIAAPDLQGAIAGSELFVARNDNEVQELIEKADADVNSIFDSVDKTQDGLLVKASTLGSLEALIDYLKSKGLSVSSVGIGPLHRKDMLAIQYMAARDPRYAVVLAFNVEITPEASKFARENGITIYSAEIIYHLTDMYDEYLKKLQAREKEAARAKAVWPCELEVIDIIHRSKPVIVGVRVVAGKLRKGTPVSAITKDRATKEDKVKFIGTIDSLQRDGKPVDKAEVGMELAVCIKDPQGSTTVADDDFVKNDRLISKLTRPTIDILKEHFKEEMEGEDWNLVRRIKVILNIP